MPRHYIGERTAHDVGNFKDFCGSKDNRDGTSGSSGNLDIFQLAIDGGTAVATEKG